jgi:kinesin family protein 3/17
LSKDVKAKLEVKESPEKGIFIKDLSINMAKTHEDLMEFMTIGNKNRAVG